MEAKKSQAVVFASNLKRSAPPTYDMVVGLEPSVYTSTAEAASSSVVIPSMAFLAAECFKGI